MQATTFVRGASKGSRALVLLAAMAVALLGLVLAAQAPASAHDHRVPKAVLMKGTNQLQIGHLRAYCWIYPPDANGDTLKLCSDQTPNWPEEDRVATGSKLRVRVFKTQKPEAESFKIVAFPRVDRWGYETGTSRELPVSLKPVIEDGKTVAWDAIFYVNRADRHYYLYAGGQWQDAVVGSDQPPQDAWWNFHVKTRSAS